MGVVLLLLALILAQGSGFVVTPPDIQPYWENYVKSNGVPSNIEQKREIVMNYLGDYLLYKRAKELKLDQDETFQKTWNEAKAEVLKRGKREKIDRKTQKLILERLKRTLLIARIVNEKVLPRIKITEEEIQQLVSAHESKKRGRKLTRENAIQFLKESKQSEALSGYIEELMDRYKVKINEKALEKLKSPLPAS